MKLFISITAFDKLLKYLNLFQGTVEAQGTPEDLSRSGIDIAKLISQQENVESPDPYTRRLSKTSARVSNFLS